MGRVWWCWWWWGSGVDLLFKSIFFLPQVQKRPEDVKVDEVVQKQITNDKLHHGSETTSPVRARVRWFVPYQSSLVCIHTCLKFGFDVTWLFSIKASVKTRGSSSRHHTSETLKRELAFIKDFSMT